MKIENIKLFRFISKKINTIKIIASVRKSLITIEPNIILMKVFSLFLRLILADKIPARKFKVVIDNPTNTEMNWE
ncbi:MAG TPA: hypothetical protein VLN45_09745 [Ignavibacteriaceae bacterium]|nr:hypothetical protein [Ignavibacteriaceae bacterium]